MNQISYVEDAFIALWNAVTQGSLVFDEQDFLPASNFYKIISSNDQLTENQGKFVLRLLRKYQTQTRLNNIDYEFLLEDPRWRSDFRMLDLSKSVFVELDQENIPWVCLKFPFQLKEKFEREIISTNKSVLYDYFDNYWDKEKKIRKLNPYNYNIIQLHEFLVENNFEIQESFVELLNLSEEIWNNSETIAKRSVINNNEIELVNAESETIEYFLENKKKSNQDLLLAKSMGYFFEGVPTSLIEKIAATEHNWVWIKNLVDVLSITNEIDGKILIVLDRSSNYKEWLFDYSREIERLNIDKASTKICFREDKEKGKEFNQWIADNSYGGSIADGKYYIFLHRPNKWLYDMIKDVKVIITNMVYTPSDHIISALFKSHPCVIYVGDTKPSESKDRKIVEL